MREPFSAVSHWFGLALALYLAALLDRLARGDTRRRLAAASFSFSLCLLYAVSASYHTVEEPALVDLFRRLDHSAIFVLIAGTCSPPLILEDRHRSLAVLWLLAAVGMTSKWFLPLGAYPVTVALYAALALVGLLALLPILPGSGRQGIVLVVAGGMCYAAGGLCDLLRWPVLVPGVIASHEVLHVFDLCGSGLHAGFAIRLVRTTS